MAYTKTVWQTGDVITAAKLNNAEDGIEAASPIEVLQEWTRGDDYYETTIALEDVLNSIKAQNYSYAKLPAIADVFEGVSLNLSVIYISAEGAADLVADTIEELVADTYQSNVSTSEAGIVIRLSENK